MALVGFSQLKQPAGGAAPDFEDDFTYSDGQLDSVGSAKWATGEQNAASFDIVSNQLVYGGGGVGRQHAIGTYGNDQRAGVDIIADAAGASTFKIGPYVRKTAASGAGYNAVVDLINDEVILQRNEIALGTRTYAQILTDHGVDMASLPKRLEIEVIGTSLKVYVGTEGSMVEVTALATTRTDWASGSPGLWGYSTSGTATLDNYKFYVL